MAEAPARQQKTETMVRLYDGSLRLERRKGAPEICASTSLQGENLVKTTGEITLSAVRATPTR
jgi:hypothetical protein